jgi:hypothetical protein
MIWKRRITPALRSVFLLSPSVRRTSASDSGSSLMPTATADDAKSSGSRMTARSKAHPGTSLTDFVRQDGATGRLFPTPAAGDSNNGCPGDGREHYRLRGKPSLETMARKDLWPTPSASLGEHAGLVTPRKGREGGTLVEAMSAQLWPTPRASEANQDFAKFNRSTTGISLPTAAQIWPTPVAGDSNSPGPNQHTTTLGREIKREALWLTPAQRDYRHPNASSYQERGGAKKGEQLPNAVGGVLNPAWVSALMGYPPEWMACAPGKAIGKPGSRARSRSTPDESGA